MAKDLSFGNSAREKVLAGVEKLAKTVAVTMGPKGKFVILGKPFGAPTITKDGVSVAREINLADPIEEMGCQLVKESAGRTADIAGDGTTTSTVLTYQLFKGGMTLVDSGYSPIHFREGIQWALSETLKNIDELSEPINTYDDLKNIAIISANNDPSLGAVIAEAFHIVGESGMVSAEACPGIADYTRKVDGLELKSGYISTGFLDKNETKTVLTNCRILICDREITHLTDNPGLFGELSQQNKSLLVICTDLKKEALQVLVTNHQAGRLKVSAIKIPNFGRKNDMWLEDLALLVGTKIVGEDRGFPLSEVVESDLGFAEKIEVSKYVTKITAPKSNRKLVEERISEYKTDMEKLIGDLDRKDIRDRLSFLSSNAAVITVGYSTEAELREKGDRVEDAMWALRAAQEQGYVPGGGFALLKAATGIDVSKAKKDWLPAIEVFIEACKSPAKQILANAQEDVDTIINNVMQSNVNDKFYGYNSAVSSYCNLKEAGIIDPRKVTRTALQNATSIALLLLTTEAVVSESADNPSGWQPPAGYRLPSNTGLNHKY